MALKDIKSFPLDLYIDQGDTFYQEYIVKDITGLPLNLSTMTVSQSMKRYFNSVDTYTIPFIVTIKDALNGIISLNLTDIETTKLKHDRYVYSIKLSDRTNVVKILGGHVLISQY